MPGKSTRAFKSLNFKDRDDFGCRTASSEPYYSAYQPVIPIDENGRCVIADEISNTENESSKWKGKQQPVFTLQTHPHDWGYWTIPCQFTSTHLCKYITQVPHRTSSNDGIYTTIHTFLPKKQPNKVGMTHIAIPTSFDIFPTTPPIFTNNRSLQHFTP